MQQSLLLSLLLVLLVWACQPTTEQNAANQTPAEPEEPVYSMVDEMPRFPGCETLEGEPRQACANKKLLEYVRSNLQYPSAAKATQKEGRAVIGFNIGKDGKVSKAEIIRDPGDGMGQEAKRIVESFPDFIPGKQQGEAVIVRYNLPIRFKLD
ncbi:MAG: energy transducer TonB [Bacteroidota bacterium]